MTQKTFDDSSNDEKQKLDKIIKEYSSLVASTKHLFTGSDPTSKKWLLEKEKFDTQFAQINCQIQEIRSNNDGLMDDIKNKEEHLKKLNADINEKKSLGQLLEERIYEIKTNNQ